MNTLNDADLVAAIGEALIGEMDAPGKVPETRELQLFSDIYNFDLEIGSGASYEQYFRWASKAQIDNLLSQLSALDLDTLTDSTRQAIDIAFPDGVPSDPDAFDDCLDWSEEQEESLEALYDKEENIHALIEEKLACFARSNDLLTQVQ